jgi:hypothetical protein
VHSTRCELWPYRFGCREPAAIKNYGEIMLTPGLGPGDDVELEDLPGNPREYKKGNDHE